MANRTLIKDACLITMDDALGDFDCADLPVEGSKIVAVGENLAADEAGTIDGRGKIAIPGLVDAHRHVWQANIRHLTSNFSLMEYAMTVRGFMARPIPPMTNT